MRPCSSYDRRRICTFRQPHTANWLQVALQKWQPLHPSSRSIGYSSMYYPSISFTTLLTPSWKIITTWKLYIILKRKFCTLCIFISYAFNRRTVKKLVNMLTHTPTMKPHLCPIQHSLGAAYSWYAGITSLMCPQLRAHIWDVTLFLYYDLPFCFFFQLQMCP